MTDSNVFKLAQPGTFTDSLTDILHNGAQALLAYAVEAESAGVQLICPTAFANRAPSM